MSNKEIKRLSHNVHDSLRSSTFLFDLPRVVEELVHNSVDAGSTKVVVSLSVRSCYFKVEDDGCGVSRDGLVILGERNATSKVHLVADAGTGTETLGFRGEALSSISDISLLEIRSKARGNPNAYCKIIKSSKCLFFGIDDQREDVGTTVVVRDLFYNQPIRRKFMQSSIRKVLHSVKKCVFQIALVHPYVSFTVIEIDGEHKLLCTIPGLSSLPIVTDGFGYEVSSSLREIVYSDQELTLSGYLSGPTDALSTKVFQYICILFSLMFNQFLHAFIVSLTVSDINARFVCKGPIHNLINNLAASFHSSIAKWRDSSDNNCRKRQKTQGHPAYLLNLCCPMSSYDLSFEPSKTRVEFKDWGTVLYFFEQAIVTYWEQFVSNLFQGGSTFCETSFQESEPLREDMFSEGITKHSELRSMKDSFNFCQGSVSCNQVSNPVDTSSGDASNYKKHNRLCDNQEDYASFSKRCFQHEVNSLQGASTNCKHSRSMNCKRCVHCEIQGDLYDSPLACDSSNKTYTLMENEEVNSACCSASCMFGENQDFLKESFFDKEECTTGENWHNNCLHGSDNLIFKKNISNSFLQERNNLQRPVIGVIRKCQKLTQHDTTSFEIRPFFHDDACLSEETRLSQREVAEYVDTDSNLGFLHFGLTNPWIARTPPRFHDTICDSTLIQNHVYMPGTDCKHRFFEETNAEFLDTVLNESREVLPDLNLTGSTAVNHKFCSNTMKHLQYDCLLNQFTPTKGGLASILNKEKGFLLSESSSIRHADIYNTSLQNFVMQNHDETAESPTKNMEFQYSFFSYDHELRLRSHSAPPFYKGKKKFPILNCLPTDNARENSKMKSSDCIDVPGLNCQLEPYSTSQPSMKPITELRQPCLREFNYEKSNKSNMVEMQTCEEIDNGSVADEIDPESTSLTKWRTGSLLPAFNHDAVMPHKIDVLDISSGLLHLAGSSLVPASINKDCLNNARVLLQLDRKFIPVVASGILVIIDQHAADERIRLEELRKRVLHGELRNSTYLNPEHELVLPEMGYQLLQKYAEQIKKWGWICNIHSQCSESFTWSMNFLRQHKCRATLAAVPHILGTDLTGKDLLEYIEQLVETDGSSMIPPAVARILNYKACRGAIMFGDALLPSECFLIVEELKATSLCFQCAHGRPTTIPLLNMLALHEQLSRLDMQMTGRSDAWHGLRRHTPTIKRARQRLESCKRFLHG